MPRHARLITTISLLATLGAGCSTMGDQSSASDARLTGSSVYPSRMIGAPPAAPDPYHSQCTGACLDPG